MTVVVQKRFADGREWNEDEAHTRSLSQVPPQVPFRPSPNGVKKRRSFSGQHRAQEPCVKVKVAVLRSPSLISLMVSVDVKHRERRRRTAVASNVFVCAAPAEVVARQAVSNRF